MKPPRVRLPYIPVLLAAYVDEALSRVTDRHPMIPLTGVRELNMPQNPVEGAMEKAIEWFRDHGYVGKKLS